MNARERMSATVRLLFATDLHGEARPWAALLARAAAADVDALVVGGDLLPIPHGRDRLAAQRSFIRDVLGPAVHALRTARPALGIFGVLGNDDWATCADDLAEHAPALTLLDGGAKELGDGLWIGGGPWVPATPFGMSDHDRPDVVGWTAPVPKRRALVSRRAAPGALPVVLEVEPADVLARRSIADELDALATRSDPARTVLLVHGPPRTGVVDLMNGRRSVGSEALRAHILRHQPPLSLHGHIHEAPHLSGRIETHLGRTLVVNPGASRAGLRAVRIDLSADGATIVERSWG
jgi:Icc-related predicted phosphoesterase